MQTLKLKNYRNLNLHVELAPHANLIIAANGSGKSNLLEAIIFASSGNTLRATPNFTDVIQHGAEFSQIELTIQPYDNLRVVISNGQKKQRRFLLNEKSRALKNITSILPVTLFAPNSVDLIGNDPAGRRHDLDNFLSYLYTDYAELLTRYNKIIKNRNALLKHLQEYQQNQKQLDYWDQELLNLGTKIFNYRQEFLQEITPQAQELASKLYNQTVNRFNVTYPSALDLTETTYDEYLQQKIAQNREKEITVGQTLYGPHRHDYSLELNGDNLRFLGSRGQQRLAIFIWKLSHYLQLETAHTRQPIFLIDDLMSELDNPHRQKVADFLLTQSNMQFILTAADVNDVPESLQQHSKQLKLEA